jgi:hypothetical protein
VLIVCEGKKTEPHYFEALIGLYKLNIANVIVDPNANSAPISVVQYAKKAYKKDLKKNGRENGFNKVYCVFDRDEHPTYFSALESIQTATPPNVFQAITSIPCFEFWLLLHLWEGLSTSPIVRRGNKSPGDCACELLEAYVSEYSKGSQTIIEQIIGPNGQNITGAIEKAKQNEVMAEREQRDNPRTLVHILVEYLQNIKNPQKPMQVRASQLLEEMVDTSEPYIVASNYGQLQTIFNGQPKLLEQIGDVWGQIEACVNQSTVLSDETKVVIRQKIEELRQP